MDLILWRHADARDARQGEPDAERPLTAKGERQAARMGHWLSRQLPDTTRVLVSPTLRTRQTAAHLDRKLRLCADVAPGASVDTLLEAARWPDARDPVLVVGHQDTLGLTVAWLLAHSVEPWTVRKGAVWWLRRREREDTAPSVVLHAALSPDHV
jgi:phosphohistidine phosphatase